MPLATIQIQLELAHIIGMRPGEYLDNTHLLRVWSTPQLRICNRKIFVLFSLSLLIYRVRDTNVKQPLKGLYPIENWYILNTDPIKINSLKSISRLLHLLKPLRLNACPVLSGRQNRLKSGNRGQPQLIQWCSRYVASQPRPLLQGGFSSFWVDNAHYESQAFAGHPISICRCCMTQSRRYRLIRLW